jgi:hypothetical protein
MAARNPREFGGKVSHSYIGQPIGNGQDPDEPYDHTGGAFKGEGGKIGGMGAQGSGSKPTPQRALSTTGSGTRGRSNVHNSGSYPRNPQKLRG